MGTGLVLGLALGLFVGFAGVASPAQAVEAPKDYDIRKGQSNAERDAYTKKIAEKYNVEKYAQDPKYTKPTTCCGNYHKTGMDSLTPVRGIPPDGNDGPLANNLQKFIDADNKALLERVKPFLGKSDRVKTFDASVPYSWGKTAGELK